MPKLTYPISSERLHLRPNVASDLAAVHAFQSRDDVTRFVPWYSRTLDEVRVVLEKRNSMTDLREDGDALVLAIVLNETDELIGEVYLFLPSKLHRQGEIGYLIHPDYHGHGYGTEAARLILGVGFEHFGMHRIVARCDARNDASYRVMERIGMRREAHLRENEIFKGEWSNELVYAMLESEWRDGAADQSR